MLVNSVDSVRVLMSIVLTSVHLEYSSWKIENVERFSLNVRLEGCVGISVSQQLQISRTHYQDD